MAKMLVVDGVEKSGKSTLLAQVTKQAIARGYFIVTHHWDRPQTSHWAHKRVLLGQLDAVKIQEKATGAKGLILWDRSQASEYIYSILMKRGGQLDNNPLLGEFQYGRVQSTLGPKLILLGPSLEAVKALRDSTDMPVDPAVERDMFRKYGTDFCWQVHENPHDPQWAEDTAAYLLDEIDAWPEIDAINTYVGPPKPEVVVLAGSSINAWIPFSYKAQTDSWEELGGSIMAYGYATSDAPKEILRQAKLLVVPEKKAAHIHTFARYYLGFPEERIITMPEFKARVKKQQEHK